MPKLQRIKRANGSVVFSVNIPLEIVEELSWEKGDNLNLEIKRTNEKEIIIIFRKEDDNIKEQEEKQE